jgi:SAM-dependent methyltransferase
LTSATNPTARFSDRVENYVRYRPGYPPEVVVLLRAECGLTPDHVIADIGFGTGLFTRLLLEHGNSVVGIEPNDAMRREGDRILAACPRFRSVAGTAESTTLADHSVDFVTAAQAAHWFDREKARREFVRILKPGGWIVLLWNERVTDSTPFLIAYEKLLLEYGTDYNEVRHERTTDTIQEFFAPSTFEARVFPLQQVFDYAGLEGRLLSSSYAPAPAHPRCQPMLAELRRLFDAHNVRGQVTVDYNTRVYYSRLRMSS